MIYLHGKVYKSDNRSHVTEDKCARLIAFDSNKNTEIFQPNKV